MNPEKSHFIGRSEVDQMKWYVVCEDVAGVIFTVKTNTINDLMDFVHNTTTKVHHYGVM